MLFCIIFWMVVIMAAYGKATENVITDKKAIASIVGEYARDDIYGMKLFAHAIRNRGTLKGVYGRYAAHNRKEPKEVWVAASLAWFESAHENDMLDGASAWYSYADLMKRGVPKGYRILRWYKGTVFFKRVK